MSARTDWPQAWTKEIAPIALSVPIAQSAKRTRTRFGREPWIGAVICWFAYSILGIWLAYRYGAMGDAYVRVFNADNVLFSRDPHLMAIGFAWTPLPSILALPLVAFKSFWPALVTRDIAGDLITAIFGGIAVFYWLRLLRRFRLSTRLRWALTTLFVLNPGIAFYAANGMSDLIMTAALIAAIEGLWGYLEEDRLASLLASSCWVAVAFLSRYEAIVWAAVVAGGIILAFGRLPYPTHTITKQWKWIGGFLTIWLMPLAYVLTAWVFANWAIMHDALFFLNGVYSNAAQTSTGAYASASINAAKDSIGGTLSFTAHQTLLFPPVIVGSVALFVYGLLGRQERHGFALLLLAATLGIPLLQMEFLYKGQSGGWVRYFFVFIPFGFLSVAYIAGSIQGQLLRYVGWILSFIALLVGNVATYYAMLSPLSPLRYETPNTYPQVAPIVAYLNSHPRLVVLTDAFLAYPFILQVQHPTQLIITSDRDFARLLDHPFGHVDAFLIPQPQGLGTLDAVNRRYPHMWASGTSWAHYALQFHVRYASYGDYHWRLYLIQIIPRHGPSPVARHVIPPSAARHGNSRHVPPVRARVRTVYFAGVATVWRTQARLMLTSADTQPMSITLTFYYQHRPSRQTEVILLGRQSRTIALNGLIGPRYGVGATLITAGQVTAHVVLVRTGASSITVPGVEAHAMWTMAPTGVVRGWGWLDTMTVFNPGRAAAHVEVRALLPGSQPSDTITFVVPSRRTRVVTVDDNPHGRYYIVRVHSSAPVVVMR